MTTQIPQPAFQFKTDGNPVFSMPYGNGHINLTYLMVDDTGGQYILQRINKTVFKDPVSLMGNIAAVINYLRDTGVGHRETMTLIPTRDGSNCFVDAKGEYWRVYCFVSDTFSYESGEDKAVFRESGRAFGQFQNQLAGFPADTLKETIPRFHDTPSRYAALRTALEQDVKGRAKDVEREVAFALERETYASTLTSLQAAGELPLRVTHNDTKINNVLFDRYTRKAICVIDLDTVMPGLSVNDFGDSIRFGASTAAEDERDLDRVRFSLELFEAYAQGFLTDSRLTAAEREHLRDGAKMMTLECGVRFLTDYLAGDTYFRVHREGHNLDRCRTQFKLVSEMEKAWDDMARIIAEQ
jgi:Ser/Thr protein kinase RdoA (MazF antagonist)